MDIEIKANDKRLLVDGEFTSDSVVHTVKLYCSGTLVSGQSQTVVTGARIYLTDNTDTVFYLEKNSVPGVYQTSGPCSGKGGHFYAVTITNIDIDHDGQMETYTAKSMMPVPLQFDSLVSKRGLNGDGNRAVNNDAYYTLFYNGPDYIYQSGSLNDQSISTLSNNLGYGYLTRDIRGHMVPKVLTTGSSIKYSRGLSIMQTVVEGDTIGFQCFNFTADQFNFLRMFDNNTSNKDQFNSQNIYDQLKIPTNLPTNIEPADKAAGYFFIYSVSRISKVFKE